MLKEIKSEEDIKQAAKLAEISFHMLNYEQNLEFLKGNKEFDFIGFFDENKLLAAAGAYDFQIFIRDRLFSCAGIAGVMTDPIHRKKGYVRKLMTELVKKKYSEGYELTSLWPFDHGFYQKFGYESCDKIISYKFSPSDIKQSLKVEDGVKIRESTGENDYPILDKIARNALNKYTRIIGKIDAWFLRSSSAGYKPYILERENNPVGYIILKFKKPKPNEWGTNIQVQDIAYNDLVTKHSIFAFLRNFESDIGNIFVTLPYQEEMMSYLKVVKEEHKYSMWPHMCRILDVKVTLEKLSFSDKIDATLYANLQDELIEENNGFWKFTVKEGKCSAQKVENEKVADIDVLELNIRQLTQLIVGVKTITSIFESEIKKIPTKWLEKNLFPERPCKAGISY